MRIWLAMRVMGLWSVTGWGWALRLSTMLLPSDWCEGGREGEEPPF